MTEYPRGSEDRVLGPGVLTMSSWPRGTEDRVLGPGVLMTEYLAQGY